METYIATVRCVYVQNWLRRIFSRKIEGDYNERNFLQLEFAEFCSMEQVFAFRFFPIKSDFFFRENFALIYKNVLYTFISNSFLI